MARRTLLIGFALVSLLPSGSASAGSFGGGKGGRDRTPPSIAITAPVAGTTVAGVVAAAGTAADNVKVAKIEVSVDGGAFSLAQGTGSWSFAIDTARYGDGSHTLQARATDSSGNSSLASEAINVKNTLSDTIAPAVSIAAPTGGATVSGSLAISGTASDNLRVASIAVSVDGGVYQPASGTTAWSASIDTTALADGSHAFRAMALDAAGNSSVASVSVTVRNDVTPPAVAISSPATGASLAGSVSVAGTASDNRQVVKVEVAVDGGAFFAAQGTISWTYSLDASALSAGSHTLTARATDSSGNAGAATLAFGVATSPPLPQGVVDQMVTPEGVTIQIYAGVSGWTAQQIYSLLKANALELSLIGPSLTIKVQTTYASSTSTSVSQTNGVYGSFHATTYLNASPGTVFPQRPDDVIAHEYGAVWGMYHLYISHGGDWSPYLSARGILGDPRLDSSFSWSRNEMIADDYRLLFGSPAAQSEAAYINPDIPDPRTVSGLRDFFLNVWATP